MWALKVLEKNGWKKRSPMTREEVERIRIDLENTTVESFRAFDKARRNTWSRVGSIVLD
jgi:hypothetical protein